MAILGAAIPGFTRGHASSGSPRYAGALHPKVARGTAGRGNAPPEITASSEVTRVTVMRDQPHTSDSDRNAWAGRNQYSRLGRDGGLDRFSRVLRMMYSS